MSVKSDVLNILELNRGKSVSGEILAQTLNVSRNAVWKGINELRQDGYIIEAVTNKGYILSADNDILSAEGIKTHLENEDRNCHIFVYPTLDSTNTEAKRLAGEGSENKTVVIANEQTAGRGRMGRSFFSPKDTGIYMSVILRPTMNVADSGLVTTAASVAVCRAIRKVYGLTPEIKWVNDILLKGKKVCGILTEAGLDFESGMVEYIIVGIGLNVTTTVFPENLKSAVSLQDSGSKLRNKFAAFILSELFNLTDKLNPRDFIEEYRKYSVVIGKDIEIIQRGQRTYGTALDIDENGGLAVRLQNGNVVTLTSGEISIRGEFYA